MATKFTPTDGCIDPDGTYTIAAAARIIGISPRQMREQFILTGLWKTAKLNTHARLIPGWIIKQWVEDNLVEESDGD